MKKLNTKKTKKQTLEYLTLKNVTIKNNTEKKKKYNKIFKTKNLSFVEKKYCSCLMKVRNTKFNPYGICTNSVYNLQGLKRNKVVECGKYYDFSNYTIPMLKFFLKEKKVKGISKMNKKQLLNLLKNYQNKKKQ
jgi:hypothetical protein